VDATSVAAPVGEVRSAIGDESWSAQEVVADARAAELRGRPFDETAVALCAALSTELMASGRLPETVALGFWLRPSAIARLEAGFRVTIGDTAVAVPRGLAFHVTPANVDTVFVYSWVLSMLAGNRNIVRVSSRGGDVRTRLLACIGRVMADPRFDALRRSQRIVTTHHDDEILATLSAAADVRVVWGGDATVEHLSRFPLAFRGRDVTFPDRHSLAVIDVGSILDADDAEMSRVGDRFFNDAYWFDQGACSSPRLVVWAQGNRSDAEADHARTRFHDAVVDAVARRQYRSQTGNVITRKAFALRVAAGADGARLVAPTNEATWVTIPDITAYDRDNCGGGLFFEHVTRDLPATLSSLVTTRDQTASCYGLSQATLRSLAERLAGRGIDRWVPMGRALEFGAVWDGMDLLHELTRRVTIPATDHGLVGPGPSAGVDQGTRATPFEGDP
jgi:hypothetical protein